MQILSFYALLLATAAVFSQSEDQFADNSTYVPTTLGLVEYTQRDSDGYAILYIEYKASFKIPYTNSSDDTEYVVVDMPADSDCNASFTDDSKCDVIVLKCDFAADNTQPDDLWELEMTFTVTDNTGDKDNLCEPKDQDDWEIKYEVTGLQLDYYLSKNIFTDSDAVFEKKTLGNDDLSLFEVSGDSSYKCDHDETQDVVDTSGSVNVTLQVTFSDYQSQAFQISSKQDSADFDTAKTCSADEDGSSLVPIIVGCVLAGLIVITLIAYFIGRWHQNKQGNYQAL